MIALDIISAAFDTINHSTLLARISKILGVRGTTLTWLEAYLSVRHIYVKVGENQSENVLSSVGVPQGTVLGPNLLSIYITPIMNIASAFGDNIHQYAEDTQLYVSAYRNDENVSIDALERCSAAVNDWMLHNGLALNPDKSEAIMFETSRAMRHLRSKVLQWQTVQSPFLIE